MRQRPMRRPRGSDADHLHVDRRHTMRDDQQAAEPSRDAPAGWDSNDVRNGSRPKTVLTEARSQVEIEVPQDRDGTFKPQIVKKRNEGDRRRRDRPQPLSERRDQRVDQCALCRASGVRHAAGFGQRHVRRC
ncbi:transposase [Microlunatus kandeliicorticis]|uniref:transposase n=1 Tax=Microlunatus kandeliicorticis TaxID=1759536 RepID=UPI0038B40E41